MPKIERMTQAEKNTAAELRKAYNGAFILTLEQVKQVIGVKSRNTASAWVADLIPRSLNGRPAWLVADVAVKLCATDGRGVAS